MIKTQIPVLWSNEIKNNFICLMSPEVANNLCYDNIKWIYVYLFEYSQSYLFFKVKIDSQCTRDYLNLPILSINNNIHKTIKSVWISILDKEWIPPKLELIELEYDDPIALENKEILVQNESIPIIQGCRIQFQNKQKIISFKVLTTEPTYNGVYDNKITKIILKQNENLIISTKSKPCDEKSIDYYNKLARYSSKLIINSNSYSKLLQKCFEIWKNYPWFEGYSIKEIPDQLCKYILKNKDRFSLNSSTTVFVKGDYEETLLLQRKLECLPVHLLILNDEGLSNNVIYATPCLIKTKNKHVGSTNILFGLTASSLAFKKANVCKICFLNDAIYESLTTDHIDSLVSEFFSYEKLVINNGWNIINMKDYPALNSRKLYLKEIQIYFKVVFCDGDLVCRYYTNVSQVFPAYDMKTKPSLNKMMVTDLKGIKTIEELCIDNFPPYLGAFLSRFEKLINKSVTSNVLLTGSQGSGQDMILKALSDRLGYDLLEIDYFQLLCDTTKATETKLIQLIYSLTSNERRINSIIWIKNIHQLGIDKEGKSDSRVLDFFKTNILTGNHLSSIKIVGETTEKISQINSKIFSIFDIELEVPNPETVDDREGLINWILERQSHQISNHYNLNEIASKTSGFVYEDLNFLIKESISYSTSEAAGMESIYSNKLRINDILKSMEIIQSSIADSLGAPKIPNVKWEDVGGLEEAKNEILDMIQKPLLYPKLFSSNIGTRRSGILMYGPPGVGKTLLAKAVATECALNFFSVKGPELLNKYVGQSEENVRDLFVKASKSAPCVIFFDELDSLAPNRGQSGDSGGVMDRVVSQLLAELDDIDENVFVIGATNRPDLIDQALLRPGRIDRLVYLGISQDKTEQMKVLKALTKKFKFSTEFNWEKVINAIPDNITGADIYSISSKAYTISLMRMIKYYEESTDYTLNIDNEVKIDEECFMEAISNFIPSVSKEDLIYYDSIRQKQNLYC